MGEHKQDCNEHLYIYACMLSHFSHVRLFATLWTIACQAPLFMGFSRQVYWSGFPLPSPGIEPTSHVSCISRRLLYRWHHLGSPLHIQDLLCLDVFGRKYHTAQHSQENTFMMWRGETEGHETHHGPQGRPLLRLCMTSSLALSLDLLSYFMPLCTARFH